jgi:N-acetylgalactosamine PTS system EIIA component
MSDTVRPRAMVIGHKDFAVGIVSAVEAITGRDDIFRAASNYGLDLRSMEALVRDAVADGVVTIFSDLPAGSTTMAARRVQRDIPSLVVVTGVSLPVLLDYAFASDDAHAVDAAVEKGRAAMMVARGTARAD